MVEWSVVFGETRRAGKRLDTCGSPTACAGSKIAKRNAKKERARTLAGAGSSGEGGKLATTSDKQNTVQHNSRGMAWHDMLAPQSESNNYYFRVSDK